MPQLNLTDVTGQQLRQLLDSSRRQGDAALSYRILQEMAERRKSPTERGIFKGKVAGEPRHVVVDFGEPAEADDIPPLPAIRLPVIPGEPACLNPPQPAAVPPPERRARRKRPAARTAPTPAAPLASLEAERPLTMNEPEPEPLDEVLREPDPGFQLHAAGRPVRPARRQLPLLVAVGFVVGVGFGTAAGWSLAMISHEPAPLAGSAVALAPPPEPTPPPAPAPVAAQPIAEAAPEAVPETPPSEPEAAPEPTGEAMELPAPQTPKVQADAACASEATAADRVICGDPKLRRLQGELRRAYDEALRAHEDRGLLREHQLAWRDGRSAIADPDRLAQLYQARIRKLNAATAEARARR